MREKELADYIDAQFKSLKRLLLELPDPNAQIKSLERSLLEPPNTRTDPPF